MIRCRAFYSVDLKSSSRERLPNGFLRVSKNNLTKAQVSPYYGAEVGGSDALGWEPGKVYKLFRHPDELKKAADYYNEVPLLMGHHDTAADNLPKDKVIGTIGSNAAFDGQFITNSLTVWDQDAIDAIEAEDGADNKAQELSCGYAYDLDPTPGEYDGEAYDGIMRNIRPEHMALVPAGRAGSDVRVGDAALGADGDKPGHALHGNQFLGGYGAGAKAGPTTAKPAGKKKEKPTLERESALQDIEERKGVSKKSGETKYGKVSFADPVNNKYPLDTPAHVRNALSRWGDAGNRAKYSKADQAEIGQRIRAAAKRFGIGKQAGDSGPNKEEKMNRLLSHRVTGAIHAHLRTQLAADAAIKDADLLALTNKLSAKKFGKQIDALAGAVKDKYALKDSAPLRAILKDMDPAGAAMSQEKSDGSDEDEDGEDEDGEDEDGEDAKAIKDKIAGLQAKLKAMAPDPKAAPDPSGSDEDGEDEDGEDEDGEDEDGEDKGKKGMDRKAVDAAIKVATDKAVQKARDEAKALRQAERDVEGLVGDVSALDSATAVYRYTLKTNGIDTKGVHADALRPMVLMLAKQTTSQASAADAKAVDTSATLERFPALARFTRVG